MTVINEGDDWAVDGQSILLPEALARIRNVLEEQGPIIVEHGFYRGSRAPERLCFDDYDDFIAYLTSRTKPGDKFFVWSFAEVCKDENSLLLGKYPDAQGRTPRTGAY